MAIKSNTNRLVISDSVLTLYLYRYNSALNQYLRDIPGASPSSSSMTWEFSATENNIRLLRYLVPALVVEKDHPCVAEDVNLDGFRKPAPPALPDPKSYKGFAFKTKPYEHQLRAWGALRDSGGRYALFMEMGTGKTKVVIDYLAWRAFKGHIDRVLFVAPNSLLEKEAKEFTKHYSGHYDITVLRGDKVRKIRDIQAAGNDSKLDVIVASYDSVRALHRYMAFYAPTIIVADESSRIKNGRALQSKAMHILGKICTQKILMTGTPITQSPIDVYSQYKFMAPEIFGTSFIAFRSRYCVMGGFQFRQVISYTNMKELSQKIFSKAVRFTKDECLDLPQKIKKVYKYDLSSEARRIYNDLKKQLCAELNEGTITAQMACIRLIRFQQICSGFLKLDDRESITYTKENPKLRLMEEIISEYSLTKVVVWVKFIAEITILEQWYRDAGYKVYVFSGATEAKDRETMVEEFNGSQEKCAFIGQIRTGGLGIDLVGCSTVIYYSNPWSLEDRLQSEDRTHRIGQKASHVLYIDLVGRKTVEETIMRCLDSKKNLSDMITGERATREALEGDNE